MTSRMAAVEWAFVLNFGSSIARYSNSCSIDHSSLHEVRDQLIYLICVDVPDARYCDLPQWVVFMPSTPLQMFPCCVLGPCPSSQSLQPLSRVIQLRVNVLSHGRRYSKLSVMHICGYLWHVWRVRLGEASATLCWLLLQW